MKKVMITALAAAAGMGFGLSSGGFSSLPYSGLSRGVQSCVVDILDYTTQQFVNPTELLIDFFQQAFFAR